MSNPIAQLTKFWKEARRKKDPTADYLLLATVDKAGKPHVRTVLIKICDERGVGFVTNTSGEKVKHFAAQPVVECCMVWPSLTLQIRLQGSIKEMDKKDVKYFWTLRPRLAQILYSLGLKQSGVIPSFDFLKRKVKALDKEWESKKEIPLTPRYTGYIVEPQSIEFLHHSPTRLNQREFFQKTKKGWEKSILAP